MEEVQPLTFEDMWQHYNLVRGAGENIARAISRGEEQAIVSYGDVSSLGQLPLITLEHLGDGVYSLRYENGAGRVCTVIAGEDQLERHILSDPSSCARNIPGCTLSHGPEEISAG